MRNDGLDAPDVTHELELERLLPILFRQVQDLAARRGARVVDEDVDPAEAGGRLVHDSLDVVGAREVPRHREHLRPRHLGELLGRRLERRLAACADRQPDPFLGEPARDRLADTLAAPGDQCHLSL